MTNKEKFLTLVSKEKTNSLERNKERIRNRAMLRESQGIALKVLSRLDEIGWTQKDLAEKMKVTPQQITKIVSGNENLTIETQVKLQTILDIPILASYYENRIEKKENRVVYIEKTIQQISIPSGDSLPEYESIYSLYINGKEGYSNEKSYEAELLVG